MIDPIQPPWTEPADLAERLTKYRSRVAREGRKGALERLDKAIDEAKRRRAPDSGAGSKEWRTQEDSNL